LTEFQKLQADIHGMACNKGWWDTPRKPLEVHALVSSEIGEATEEVRKGSPYLYYEGEKPEGEAVELGDAIIRILDYAQRNGWDMEDIIHKKMAYNKTRPYRHGGKTV